MKVVRIYTNEQGQKPVVVVKETKRWAVVVMMTPMGLRVRKFDIDWFDLHGEVLNYDVEQAKNRMRDFASRVGSHNEKALSLLGESE